MMRRIVTALVLIPTVLYVIFYGPQWLFALVVGLLGMACFHEFAFIANAQVHHPDLSVHYSRCVVRFNTHDVKGLSETDFECAAMVDALIA